ncbi:MAG: hypothetical protein HYZ25_01235 [Chloroflexi bacterium]|nr:hypothetical protein [Chloroflexota bacterium]
MSNKKNKLPKVYPFVQPTPMEKPLPPTPTTPRPTTKGRVSQRGLLSVLTLILSIGALTAALGGGAKLILDIFGEGLFNNMETLWAKATVLGLAYVFGWLSAVISIRVYGNLILPTIIKIYTWASLLGTSGLYIAILQRLFKQGYDLPHYAAYLLITAAGLAVVVGLHLVLEEHDLRPFAVPLLVINLGQLGLIVVRYVFTSTAKGGWFLVGDLVFFFSMLTFSVLMVTHLGLLNPYRNRITKFFDQNSVVIRPDS